MVLRNWPTLIIGTERLAFQTAPLACSGGPSPSTRQVPGSSPGSGGRAVLRVLFFSTLPSFLLPEIHFFRTFPTNPAKVLGLLYTTSMDLPWIYLAMDTTPPSIIVIRSVAGFRGLFSPLVTQFGQFFLKAEECGRLGGTLRQLIPWLYHSLAIEMFSDVMAYNNPNTINSYKILQKLSPKHAAHGVAQSTYPNYRHGKACLSKQPLLACSGGPSSSTRQVPGSSPGSGGRAARAFFLHPPFLPPSGDSFFRTFPTNPAKVLGLTNNVHFRAWIYLYNMVKEWEWLKKAFQRCAYFNRMA